VLSFRARSESLPVGAGRSGAASAEGHLKSSLFIQASDPGRRAGRQLLGDASLVTLQLAGFRRVVGACEAVTGRRQTVTVRSDVRHVKGNSRAGSSRHSAEPDAQGRPRLEVDVVEANQDSGVNSRSKFGRVGGSVPEERLGFRSSGFSGWQTAAAGPSRADVV